MSRNSIVFLISSLLIFTAVLSGCREDNPDTPTFIPDPCKVGDTYSMDIYKMKGNVVQSSLGPIIIPADTLPYRTYTGIMSAIRPLNKDEIAGGAEVVNLSPYIGQEVVFSGRVILTPYTQDTILIDGRSIIAGIHPMNITIDSSKASRSGEEEIDPCPTPTGQVQLQRIRIDQAMVTKPVVNIFLHLLRRNASSSFNKESIGTQILSNLNTRYKNGNIAFNLIGSEYLDIIDDNFYYNASNQETINRVFTLNRQVEAIDIYIVCESAKTNLLGQAEMIPSTACIIYDTDFGSITIPHEVGHCLGLYHTHYGTDGYIVDTSNGLRPAKEELVDGSNSSIAGDFITDTPADPCKWFNGDYAGGNLKDANGQSYNPDKKNIMSYSGSQEYFTSKQFEWIITEINSYDLLRGVLKRKLTENKHFKGGSEIALDNSTETDNVSWNVKHYSSISSNPTIKTYNGKSYPIISSKSELLDVTAHITYSSGLIETFNTLVTSGPPSPAIGSLAWSTTLNGSSGNTRLDNYGSVLPISGNTTLRLEYLDPVQATLNNLQYTCVTASRRVLRGPTMSLTPADCADGFLKIRISDDCGSSDEYFTIIVEVSENYYAAKFSDSEITFYGVNGHATESQSVSSISLLPTIDRIEIFDFNGNLCLTVAVDAERTVSISLSDFISGEYKAKVSGSEGCQEIIFMI